MNSNMDFVLRRMPITWTGFTGTGLGVFAGGMAEEVVGNVDKDGEGMLREFIRNIHNRQINKTLN